MSKASLEKLENQIRTTVDQDQQVSSSTSSSSSRSSSFSNSISFLKLNEIESYEPPIDNNQPILVKEDQKRINLETTATSNMMNSMPADIAQKKSDQNQLLTVEQQQQQSLPNMMDKENQKVSEVNKSPEKESVANISGAEDFQIVDMMTEETVEKKEEESKDKPAVALASITNQNLVGNQLGDSLIDMIITLKNENQNLIKSLETNNEFVKERIEEFKRATEDAKKREVQYTTDKSEHEQQIRKLQRQNLVLSERLKGMETKLRDLKSEASDGLSVAGSSSSKANSVIHDEVGSNLYPELDSGENFSLNQAATMQVDATSCELNVQNNSLEDATQQKADGHELNTRFSFDATNGENFIDELLKQCSELEKQLNNIEKRDLEICLLQQKLNIFKKGLGSKKMNNFEAKGQIELLRTEIEGLCNERKRQSQLVDNNEAGRSNANYYDTTTAQQAIGTASKLGYHLSKRATRTAVKAAKYASKQAYREQKAAAVAAAAAAAAAAIGSGIYNRGGASSSSSSSQSAAAYLQRNHQTPAATAAHVEPQFSQQQDHYHHHHGRHHSTSSHHPHLSSLRKLKTEVVNDLMSTANKAMLTGYKVASTHVNLALDKLSQFEQTQAQNLAKNQKPNVGAENLHDYYNSDKNSLD